MTVKQKNEREGEFFYSKSYPDPSLDGQEQYEYRVLGVVASDAPSIQVPGCLRYQVSLKITGPFRSKKHWPPCKYAKSQDGNRTLLFSWHIWSWPLNPKPSIYHRGNAMHFSGSTQPDQKKKERNICKCVDINMFSSANKLLYSPGAKNFKWLLSKTAQNNDVKPKPSFCGVNTKSTEPSSKWFTDVLIRVRCKMVSQWRQAGAINLILQQVMSLVRARYIMETIFSFVLGPRVFWVAFHH